MKSSLTSTLTNFAPHGAYTDISQLLNLRLIARDLNLSSTRPAKSLLSGNERTRFRGRGMDFEEVRIYQPGDDIRSIDWRVTARTQVPHTKIYSEERERPVFIVTDQRAAMFFGSTQCFKSVLAASISATLAWAAVNRGDRLGGLVFGDQNEREIKPKRSKHAVLSLLHQLNAFNHALTSPNVNQTIALAERLAHLRRVVKPGSSLFIISDFHDFDDDAEQHLFELARHSDVTLISLHDPLERDIRSNQQLTFTNGEQRVSVAVNQQQFIQQWQQHFDNQRARLIHCANRLSIPLMAIATNDDMLAALRERFASGKYRTSAR